MTVQPVNHSIRSPLHLFCWNAGWVLESSGPRLDERCKTEEPIKIANYEEIAKFPTLDERYGTYTPPFSTMELGHSIELCRRHESTGIQTVHQLRPHSDAAIRVHKKQSEIRIARSSFPHPKHEF